MRPASTATSRLRSSLTKVPDLKKIAAFSRTEAVRDSRPPFFLYPALLCCKILTVICGVEKMDARKKLSDVLGELNRVTGLSLRADEVPEEDAAEAAGRIASLVAAYRERYDKTAFVKTCDLQDIDTLVTDQQPDAQWQKLLVQKLVTLIC